MSVRMKRIVSLVTFAVLWFPVALLAGIETPVPGALYLGSRYLTMGHGSLALDNFFYETASGRVSVPAMSAIVSKRVDMNLKMPDGRTAIVTVTPEGNNYVLTFRATPDADIIKWGFAIQSEPTEYFTGLMERVVDGPQEASWAAGITKAMNLRGQKVDMILKPTTSVYAPFYISSRGYATFAKTDWPSVYDFCASDPERVKIEFEGPSLEVKIYTARTPADLVKAHALEVGPPILPPKWTFTP